MSKMPRPQISDIVSGCPGAAVFIVRGINNNDPLPNYPQTVNYAEALTYDVDVQTTFGIVSFSAVKPSVPRWPYPMLVEAFPIGSMLPGATFGAQAHILYAELPWRGPCVQ